MWGALPAVMPALPTSKDNPMTNKRDVKAMTAAKYTKLFGPGPVLSSESLQEYESILMHVHDCFQPRDFIEQLFVKDAADFIWDTQRYKLHKPMAIERQHQQDREIKVKRLRHDRKVRRERAEEEARKAEEAEQSDQATTLSERQFELEIEVDAVVPEVDEILGEPADEIAHARALQAGIDYHERLDCLETVARKRREGLLNQLEFYRQGLGSVARRVSDDIIEGEFTETKHEAPAITGPDKGDEE